MEREAGSTTTNRISALDGLRGLAILSVLLFHFKTKSFVPGGGYGVDVFLALSGYLITGLLLQEWHRYSAINLRRFWIRRVFRLLPALVLFGLVASSVTMLLRSFGLAEGPNDAHLVTGMGLTAIYGVNWAIAQGYVMPRMLGPLWSLSLEEQFYLVWPMVVIVILRIDASLRLLILVTLAAIVVSLSVPYLVGVGGSVGRTEWLRLYYGSDFRAHGLLLGSLAALFQCKGWLKSLLVRPRLFSLLAACAGIWLLVQLIFGYDRAAYMYVAGGYASLSLACSVLAVYAGTMPHTAGSRLLAFGPLTYIGRRSYSMYLWHAVIGYWFLSLPTGLQVSLGLAVTLVVAELSYRLVEAPALNLRKRVLGDEPAAVESPRPLLRVGIEDLAA